MANERGQRAPLAADATAIYTIHCRSTVHNSECLGLALALAWLLAGWPACFAASGCIAHLVETRFGFLATTSLPTTPRYARYEDEGRRRE
jgi:hypothetical protein